MIQKAETGFRKKVMHNMVGKNRASPMAGAME
jgi:hypothetical protein